jgi:hypothetical protein
MNEQDNPIIEQLKGMTQLKWGREQQSYYEQIVKDCRPVQCERMRDVLTAKQLEFIKGFYHAQQKQCYRNAAELVFLMERADWLFPEPVRYIEGYAYYLFPIEHAFVKYGDRYIDPTFERACHLDVRKELYASLIELEPDMLRRYLLETGHYGNLYQYDYWLKHEPIRAAAIRKMNE